MEKTPIAIALEAAVLVIQSGGSTAAAERSFDRVLAGFGEAGVTAVWRLDLVAASGGGTTVLHPIGSIGVNLVRAAKVEAFSSAVADRELELGDIGPELQRIRDLPSPYGRWQTVAAAAFTAAFFSQLAGGDRGSFAVAFIAAGIGQVFRTTLQARDLTAAAVTMVCAAMSAGIASLGLRFGASGAMPATFIASVIYLFPGLPLINGFLDAITYKYLLVGIERIVSAILLLLLLAIAIALAWAVVM
jgi:uncharacterized membrane protein YjjP (DUF1212 family)